jgi:CRAL/TRIO domain
LDPVVASKVHFTNNVEEMEEFVPKSQIPKDLGGDENWSYHYVEPTANENETMKDTETRDKLLAERQNIAKEYEKATLEWIDHSSPSEASEIKSTRHKLAAVLKEDYWKLDPYIRARSLYDRIGMIQPGGKICFYPISETAIPTVNGVQKVETSMDDID